MFELMVINQNSNFFQHSGNNYETFVGEGWGVVA
jgi:hypothetical protein